MSLDSVAVFAKRVQELKLGSFYNALVAAGFDTMGAFAFSCSFAPGQSDDTSFINEVVVPILGDPAHILKPQARRLFFEAYTLAALDVQRRSSSSDDQEKPRKLPAPERMSRLRTIKARLVGLTIADELEPSDSLIDKFNGQKEDGVLRLLPWPELTRRDEEVKCIKKIKSFDTDSSGRLKVAEEKAENPTDIATDLKVKEALQRRGIAMELAQLVSFEVHNRYVAWLFKQMDRKPPKDFHAVTLQQIHEADEEIFLRLAEQTRDGLEVNLDGTYRLDQLLPNAMIDPQISMVIMPKQKPVGQAPAGHKRTFQEYQQHDFQVSGGAGKAQGKAPKGGKGKEGAKGKGGGPGKSHRGTRQGGKANTDTPMLPLGLRDAKGKMTSSYKGMRICFAYNLDGCNLPRGATGECVKGKHVCARESCGGNHPQHYSGCPKL